MSRGLLDSAQSLSASLASLAHARLELLGLEAQEGLERLVLSVIGAFTVLLLGMLGIGFAAAALVLGLGEAHRALGAGLIAFVFLGLAAGAALSLRGLRRGGRRLFGASLAELERDRDALVGRSTELRARAAEELSSMHAGAARAEAVVSGMGTALAWAVRFMPLVAFLKRR